jgi:hypothetical protein
MPRGTITSYDKARGLGHIKLDTGDEVHFDVSVATTSDLSIGQTAEVVTGLLLSGKLKARLVLVETGKVDSKPFAEGFHELQELGILASLSLDEAQRLAEGAAQLTAELAGKLCVAWYGSKGVLKYARADLLAVLDEHFGDSPRIPVGDLASLAPEPLQAKLVMATVGLHPFSLGSVLSAFNGVLQEAGNGKHYFLVDVDSDRYAVVALRDDAFARAAHDSVLRIVT